MKRLLGLIPFLPLGLLLLYGPLSWDPDSVQPFGFFKQLVAFAAAMGMVLCWGILSRWAPERTHKPNATVLLILASVAGLLLLSVTLAYNKQEAVEEANRILLMLAFFAAATHIRWEPRHLKVFFWLSILPALWIAFTIGMEYTGHLDLFGVRVVLHRQEHRVLAFFGHNNIIAQYLLVLACWATVLLHQASGRMARLSLPIILAFLLTALFFTFCRSSWLSFIAAFFLTIWLFSRRGHPPGNPLFWKSMLVVLGLTILCVVGVKSISPAPGSQGFSASQWKEAGIFHHISSGRFRMWGATIDMILDNWPTGVGVGNYWVFYGKYDPARWDFVRFAHNDYLQFLAEFGLLGGLLFVVILVGMLRWAWGKLVFLKPGSDAACCAMMLALGLLAAMADAFFSYDFYQSIPAGMLAVGAGILAALLRGSQAPARASRGFYCLLVPAVLFAVVAETWVLSRQWEADHAMTVSTAYANNQDWAEAIRHGEIATSLKPGCASYENGLGVLYHRAGRSMAALSHYERARQLAPYEIPSHLGIISILKQAGDSDELRRRYPSLLAVAPHLMAARNEYATLLAEKGFFESAAAQYEAILHQDPGNPLALLKLAGTQVKLSQYEMAFQIYQRLVQMPPALISDGKNTWDSGVDIMNGLALSLDGMGKTEEAYEMLTRYRQAHPKELASYLTEIDIALKHHDTARLKEAARTVRRIDPAIPLAPLVEALLKP